MAKVRMGCGRDAEDVVVHLGRDEKRGVLVLGWLAGSEVLASVELSSDEATYLAERLSRETGPNAAPLCRT